MGRQEKKLLVLVACLLSAASATNLAELDKITQLINEGKETIRLSDAKDVVLVLGAVGSGKTTFVQWITGDNKNLISVETSKGSGEFIIEDTDNKIDSSTVPKTLFPEFVVDENTGSAFHDCPGFIFSRNFSHNIAASYFIRQVANNAENIKIVFVTSVHTVKKGVDSEGFRKLLRNAHDLIKNVDKYRESIALVVTKVDNVVVKKGDSYVGIPDSVVIESVVDFLYETKLSLVNELKSLKSFDENRQLIESAIKLIDVLLTDEKGVFTKIAIFRRPEEAGQLSGIESSQLRKGAVHKVLSDLEFTHTSNDDFGFVISDSSQIDINGFMTEISDEISRELDILAGEVLNHYKRLIDAVEEALTHDLTFELFEAEEISKAFSDGQNVISEFLTKMQGLSGTSEITESVKKLFTDLAIDVSASNIEELSKLSSHFEFLQITSNQQASFKLSSDNAFQELLNFISQSERSIRDEATNSANLLLNTISSELQSVSQEVLEDFKTEVADMIFKTYTFVTSTNIVNADLSEAQKFHLKLSVGEEDSSQLADSIQSLSTLESLSEIIDSTLERLHINLAKNSLLTISESTRKLQILETLTNTEFALPKAEWADSFTTIADFIAEQHWKDSIDFTAEEIYLKIEFLISNVADVLKKLYDEKVPTLEILETYTEISKWHEIWSQLENGFDQIVSVEELADKIASSAALSQINDLQIDSDLDGRYLTFLKALSGDNSDNTPSKQWKIYLKSISDLLREQISFSSFLNEFFYALSQYPVQSYREVYNVDDLNDWYTEPTMCTTKYGINIDRNNFRVFMQKVNSQFIEMMPELRNLVPSDAQLNSLNHVLTLTLKRDLEVQCTSDVITIKGNFVLFSEFIKFDGKMNGCDWTNKTLNIYALYTLFIDQNLNAIGDRLKLNIIAPRWVTVGNRKIQLDGEVGKAQAQAWTGVPGTKGYDGQPGNPGGPGGIFFGIGDEFVNSESLTISANGGNGGVGQAGGNGGDGNAGKNAINFDIWCDHDRMRRDGFSVTQTNYWRVGRDDYFRYRIGGTAGARGGNAGKCGTGGFGGDTGQVSLLSLSAASKASQSASPSVRGANGATGGIGKGGKNGNNFITECINQFRGVNNYHWLLNYAFGFYTEAVNSSSSSSSDRC